MYIEDTYFLMQTGRKKAKKLYLYNLCAHLYLFDTGYNYVRFLPTITRQKHPYTSFHRRKELH